MALDEFLSKINERTVRKDLNLATSYKELSENIKALNIINSPASLTELLENIRIIISNGNYHAQNNFYDILITIFGGLEQTFTAIRRENNISDVNLAKINKANNDLTQINDLTKVLSDLQNNLNNIIKIKDEVIETRLVNYDKNVISNILNTLTITCKALLKFYYKSSVYFKENKLFNHKKYFVEVNKKLKDIYDSFKKKDFSPETSTANTTAVVRVFDNMAQDLDTSLIGGSSVDQTVNVSRYEYFQDIAQGAFDRILGSNNSSATPDINLLNLEPQEDRYSRRTSPINRRDALAGIVESPIRRPRRNSFS
jgi:hypothetical protein